MRDLNTLDLDSLFAHLTADGSARKLIQLARDEDLGARGDVTSRACFDATSPGGAQEGVARLVYRGGAADAGGTAGSVAVLAGLRAAGMVLQALGPEVALEGRAADGKPLEEGQVVAILGGPLTQVLAVERTLLNLVSRLSGIATRTAAFVAAAKGGAAMPKVFDTRKTTPGWRSLEKYAVRCGGGHLHRIGLYDAVLIKDNHLAGVGIEELARFVWKAATKARAIAQEPSGGGEKSETGLRFIEVEVDSIEQLQAILMPVGNDGESPPPPGGCGVEIVLLDNMTPEQLTRCVHLRDQSGVKIELEASGGVSLKTIGEIAATGVERISTGSLTHHAVWLDFALDIDAG